MATTARQTKGGARKGPPEPTTARRTPAWTGARASPTYSPSNVPPRPPAAAAAATPVQGSFPPLGQTNGARPDNPRDRVLQSLSGLTGTTVTLLTKTSQRYEGVVGSTEREGDTTGVTLKDVRDITTPGAPLKDQLFIAATNIESYTSGPADAKPTNGDSFRTDADISQKKGTGRERDLQAWVSGEPSAVDALGGDDATFGPSANGTSWDQFTANEQLFGVKASFDEDVYTTKLDRSAPDFKERERKAQRLANEIIGAATNNPHIAEERGFVDDSGVNEEDKYGAVVRGQNAYVPPGARKTGGGPPSADNVVNAAKADVPKLSVNGPDGTTVPAQAQSPPSSKAPSPAPAGGAGANPTAAAAKPPADPLPAFRDFVTNEKQRLTQKRQALVKSEMDKRMAELVKFSQNFKLNKPIPEDLVPILAKDETKQRAIKEKASKDAASTQARAIGASTPATASRGVAVAGAKIPESARKPTTQAAGVKAGTNNVQASVSAANAQKMANAAAASAAAAAAATSKTADSGNSSKKINMVIQTIPPFKGSNNKGKQAAHTVSNNASPAPPSNGATPHTNRSSAASPAVVTTPVSPNTAANRLNVNASSFRPNPKVAPSPKMNASGGASASASPKPNKADSAPGPPNPFFGTRPIKKSTPVHVKDDFNPFKHNKVVDASQVAALWPYSGKRYMQMFPPPQHQPTQHPTHMAPPVPPPMTMPPPSYEEDTAAQAAAQRGYVYTYPPYGYPQHMMPGMGPPGPPGAYMPGPYMQPMPYPPGMPPPNAMYSPAMGQMPPPGSYMPPPPGAYPPPNGAGPRPSMPPTPIPAHAHPYYHQSPQLQHAYPMMMPPPQNIPPHGYDGGPVPPVPMGGHA
ncbi:hypothetical protein B0H34DRAFT_731793 [Crassisporium funariophilum]|nr:hypothetical protein B0H34DRAFT_731793 [Crassisporium funariophilum]